jgi:hypothetical protein
MKYKPPKPKTLIIDIGGPHKGILYPIPNPTRDKIKIGSKLFYYNLTVFKKEN